MGVGKGVLCNFAVGSTVDRVGLWVKMGRDMRKEGFLVRLCGPFWMSSGLLWGGRDRHIGANCVGI